ncbi:MAG: guanylate kinase [Bacillota bacterium]
MFDSQDNRGNLIILSGPSAVGKGTILAQLMDNYDDIHYSVSATTREARSGEENGIDYYFMSEKNFKSLVEDDQFLEWAKVHDNYYGTPKKYVEETLDQGEDVILEIDIQGAAQIKNKYPEGIFIFLLPPSLEELKARIHQRGTETEEAIKTRLKNAEKEMSKVKDYDYAIVNDKIKTAVNKVKSVIIAERCKI